MPHYSDPAAANALVRNYVPGRGPEQSDIIFIGEAPGPAEDKARMPFIGQAGQELERYCRSAGIDLSTVRISNLVKYWPMLDARGKQLPPSPTDIARDEPDLLAELAICRPKIIVAIGAHSARYFLKEKFSTMRMMHGIPQRSDSGYWIIPVLHPAAGLHSMLQEEMSRIQWDFQQVGKLMRGQLDLRRVDSHPDPQYRRLYDAELGAEILADLLAGKTEISIDTEGTVDDPECLTLSVCEGEGWFIGSSEHDTLAVLDRHINAPHSICTLIYHYLVHDIPVCEAENVHIALRRSVNADGSPAFRCTMNELHLLGGTEPKGLKAAEWRLCSMESDSYEEVAKESAYETSRAYLEQAFAATVCLECYGLGRTLAKRKIIRADCTECGGTGRVEGKRAGTTKQCACVKTVDRCIAEGCVDGLRIPRPDKELEWSAEKGEFYLKQPQSMAKWIKKRVLSADLLAEDGDSDSDDDEPESADDPADLPADALTDDSASSSSADEADDDSSAPEVAPYFKIRKGWRELPPARRMLVEPIVGKMPRVALRHVKDQDRVTKYAAKDSDATLRVAHKLDQRIAELGLERARQIDIAMLPMLARMERNGMMIDRAHFEEFHEDLQKWLALERDKLSQLVGEKNPNSKRMVDVLFRDLRLPTIKLTASGKSASTDDETLGILKAQLKQRIVLGDGSRVQAELGIAVLDCMQSYREFQKMDSTYVLALLEHADHQDRVHTTINYTKSVSRFSSENPNLFNIPNPDNSPYTDDLVRNLGLRMRAGFIARPGYKIVDCDLSSIEMVVGAHLTQDRNLMRIFHEGLDPHRYAASEFLGVPMDIVPKPIRTQFKTLNFAAFYDTSATTIQRQFALMQPSIDKSIEECEALVAWYFSLFCPDVLAWKERVRRDAQADGTVRTMFGRLRWVPGLRSQIKRVRSAAERECTNFPIQGTARDIFCIGLAKIWEDILPALWADGIDAQPILPVYDAVTLEVPIEYAEPVGYLVAETLRTAVELSVPVKVSVGIGDNWAEAH